MKILKSIFCFVLVSVSMASYSQSETKQVIDTVIHVDGICEMCKTRIENAADMKGVKLANWNQSTHELRVVYRTDKMDHNSIVQAINEAGHDTESSKATPEQYDRVHACCKYREQEAH